MCLIPIDVVRSSVGENQQEAMPGRLSCESCRRMPNGGAESREAARFERVDAAPHRLATALPELLDGCDLHVRRILAGKRVHGIEIAERIERFAGEEQGDTLEIDDTKPVAYARLGRSTDIDEQRDRQSASRRSCVDVQAVV